MNDLLLEIDRYLDESMKKKLTDTTLKEEVNFIESKWKHIDNSKYSTDIGFFICGSTVNRYALLHDVSNMERWFEEYLMSYGEILDYDKYYFYGSSYLKCECYSKAMYYFQQCFDIDRERFLNNNVTPEEKAALAFFKNNDNNVVEKDQVLHMDKWSGYFKDNLYVAFDYDNTDDEQLTKALSYIENHQVKIIESILKELFKQYRTWKKKYDIEDGIMPCIKRKMDLCSMIRINKIHIMPDVVDEINYIGYEFSCDWDIEHGLGFMMYKDEVIDSGEAEISFSHYSIKEDMKKRLV